MTDSLLHLVAVNNVLDCPASFLTRHRYLTARARRGASPSSMNSAGESYGTSTAVVNGLQDGQPEQRHQNYQHQQQHASGIPDAPAGNGSAGLSNGASAMSGQQHMPSQSFSHAVMQKQPIASTSTLASPTKPSNKIRKWQKVEYDPVKRFYNDHPGAWDATQVEEVVSHALSKRQKRTARDLGRRSCASQAGWRGKHRM